MSTKAQDLLGIFSFLDPETIQRDLIVRDHKEDFLEFLNSGEQIKFNRMINQLSGRRLISIRQKNSDHPVYGIHRLLQQKILMDLTSLRFDEAFEQSFCLVRKCYPRASAIQVPEPEKWPDCEKNMPHVYSLWRNYKDLSRIKPSFELAQLFYDAGFHIWERQTTAYNGLLFLDTANEMLDRIDYNPNHKLRADIYSIMAQCYDALGVRSKDQCIALCENALRIRQEIYDADPADEVNNTDVLLQNATTDMITCFLNKYMCEKAAEVAKSCHVR